ncbi:MAG: hypothetical protein JWN47_167, partial [Frankiales bacterium]|nr:hypothetical protein [Frankiales bacterium]
MSEYPNFTLEIIESVATVTIDRPDKRNALTIGMWQQLSAICAELRA